MADNDDPLKIDWCARAAKLRRVEEALLTGEMMTEGRFGEDMMRYSTASLDQVQRADRDGAAVHPPDDARLVQYGEVAAHGLGGDLVGLRQLGDRGAALGHHQRGDRLLPFLGVHGTPFMW